MRWNESDVPEQHGTTAVVTGANSGIGFETARVLAAKGAHVVLACRSEERGKDAVARIEAAHPEASVELMLLDLSKQASVRAFAEELRAKHARVDVLVNNAGVMATPLLRTEDGFELQMATNHFGHFALTGLLLPVLLQSEAPRVVSVSSVAHLFGKIRFEDLHWERRYSRWLAYGQSKIANLYFTYELQRFAERHGLPLRAMASHPGWTATNLQKGSRMIGVLNPVFAMKPIGGAMPSLYAATSPDVEAGAYYGPDGWLGWSGGPTKVKSNARSRDEAIAKRLWDESEALTGVRFELPAKTRTHRATA